MARTVEPNSSVVAPIEIVCPPFPRDKRMVLTPMIVALLEAGSTGTEVAAFGVHIIVEIPRLDAAHMHA